MIEAMRYNVAAEQSLLGALLHEIGTFDRIGHLVQAEDFFTEAHRQVFSAIAFLISESKPVDVVTVDAELQRRGASQMVGGLAYLAELAMTTPSTANTVRYAELVRNKSIERQLQSAANEIHDIVTGTGSVTEKVDRSQQAIMAVADRGAEQRGPVSIADVAYRTLEEIDRRINSDSPLVGLPTGFDHLDSITNGLKPGELIVIAGRPAMGKSTFAVNIAENVALDGHGVLLVSTEMLEGQLGLKHIASLGGVDLERITNGRGLTDDDYTGLTVATQKMHGMPLSLDESARTVAQIATSARKTKRVTGLKLIVVDYLQQLEAEAENRVQAVGDISRGLKQLAKSLGVTVIALSQLSRKVEERNDKRPMMADLRESGAIEQDADMIVFMYRDEYYNPDTPMKGLAEAIVAKNRMGKTGTALLASQLQYSRFRNADQRAAWDAAKAAQENKPKRRATFDE